MQTRMEFLRHFKKHLERLQPTASALEHPYAKEKIHGELKRSLGFVNMLLDAAEGRLAAHQIDSRTDEGIGGLKRILAHPKGQKVLREFLHEEIERYEPGAVGNLNIMLYEEAADHISRQPGPDSLSLKNQAEWAAHHQAHHDRDDLPDHLKPLDSINRGANLVRMVIFNDIGHLYYDKISE